MSDELSQDDSFVDQAAAITLENISDENFGVSELAAAMNMSRSSLLRKIKGSTRLSASQFIRQVRLEKGMELLGQTSKTVSEVSFDVGFGSTSYFIKCFREYYGYPPGEVGKRGADKNENTSSTWKRQLAAIMFTDIKGYTSLMQKDESQAVAFRERHREVFDVTTRKYNGRILQYYGDGTLSTFPSAIDAVQCAIEMQLAFTNEEPKIPIRIGIHLGDIIVTGDEIIGDGVNIAARIESLAAAGTVYISEKVRDEIKNHTEFLTASKGVHTLKNVAKPMHVYAVSNHALGGLTVSEDPATHEVGAKSNVKWIVGLVGILLLLVSAYAAGFFSRKSPSAPIAISEKSIAVLPFNNESSDSSNLYFVNGLMESTLTKLQKIKDLRVVSRSSVERYRSTDKTIPEIGEELNVNYFVTGSGQKIGDQVLLNIQLIEANNDHQIWAEQYNREVVDIFELQNEVARKIAGSIEAIVTPSELAQLEKKPTENLQAYDYYLQALDPFFSRTNEGLLEAIGLFEKATEEDPEFALAYANIAISYYLLEMFQVEKENTEKINIYADKALLLDPRSAEGLTAKAFYYIQIKDYTLALPHLEKALEYNPNSSLALQMLADFYYRLVPDTEKYLEYSLRSAQRNVVTTDSSTQSYLYVQLSNALVASGFADEALKYINLALDYNAENYYGPYLKALILFARDGNLPRSRNMLIREWHKDSTRIDILQDIAQLYYSQEDYDSAFFYFKIFVESREEAGLDIYVQQNAKIAKVYDEMGLASKAKELFSEFSAYSESDQSPYRSINMALKYAYEEKFDLVLEQLNIFSDIDNFQYWYVKIDNEPLFIPIRDDPEFVRIIQKIKDRFWENQARLEKDLKEKGLLQDLS